jgi:uncharacterized protein (DUF736 family)
MRKRPDYGKQNNGEWKGNVRTIRVVNEAAYLAAMLATK